MEKNKTIQHLIGVHTGAEAVALEALYIIKEKLGPASEGIFISIRQKLIEQFKTSGITPEHELNHADIVRPVIDEIGRLLDVAERC